MHQRCIFLNILFLIYILEYVKFAFGNVYKLVCVPDCLIKEVS